MSTLPRPSDEDIRSACYFAIERSLERWVDWPKKREAFEQHFPAFVKAYDDKVVSQQTFEIITAWLSRQEQGDDS